MNPTIDDFPRTLAGYRLVAGLGKGGMARVFLALAQKQGGFTKLLVLKVLRGELDADGEFLDMFKREARLAARLNHPHVVQTYEVGEDAGRHFIAMEYLEGQALSTVLTRVGRDKLPLGIHLRVLCEALEGLHYAHELADYDGTPLQIVHRDVSPQNVIVTYTGQAKVLDFGIAKVSNSTRTHGDVLKGKVTYMAPEQAAGKPIDCRADVFSIGVMLWEAIARRRFVESGESDVVALSRRVMGQDRRIRDVVPDAPTELADICDKAMAQEPDDRYATAAQFAEALSAYAQKADPTDARKVALLLEQNFGEERTRIRKLVEEQVKQSDLSLPMIDLRSEKHFTPVSGKSVEIPVATQTISGPPPARSRAVTVGIAAVAVLVSVGATALIVSRSKGSDTPRGAGNAPIGASSAAVERTKVIVSVRTVPPQAALSLDGAPVANPYRAEFAKDGSPHALEASLAGYTTERKSISWDGEQDVVLTLTAAPQASAVASSAPAPNAAAPRVFRGGTQAPQVPDVDLSGVKVKRPQRAVDDKDPYQ